MTSQDSIDLVNRFWATVWNPPYDLAAVDQWVVTDFVITSAGQDITSSTAFKTWIANFQAKIDDLHLTPLETFANIDGSRVTSRWRITGKNNGVLGTAADGQPIALTGIAIWAIADGRLVHNWVERSAFELYTQLNN